MVFSMAARHFFNSSGVWLQIIRLIILLGQWLVGRLHARDFVGGVVGNSFWLVQGVWFYGRGRLNYRGLPCDGVEGLSIFGSVFQLLRSFVEEPSCLLDDSAR